MARIIDSQFVYELKLLRDEVESFDVYPFSLPAVKQLDVLPLHPKVTFFVGENGTGKSTLMEAIAVEMGLNREGGSRNFQFSTRDSLSDLHKVIRLVKGIRAPKDSFFLRAESFFNVATEIDQLDPALIEAYGGRSLHEQSHGESFMALFQNRFGGDGLYILDEPEAALSPIRQMSLLTLMHDLVRAGSQFIIATHSPILMAYPDAWIYELGPNPARIVALQETEHYKLMKYFLNHTEKMVDELLNG